MTIKEKKEFLNSYKLINSEINRLLSEREHYYALSTRITASYSDVPLVHNNNSKIENAVEKIEIIENKINEKLDELTEKKKRIENAVLNLGDETLKEILLSKYFNYETMKQISKKIHYNYEYTCQLHLKALKKLII